jgi:hypothetical protein
LEVWRARIFQDRVHRESILYRIGAQQSMLGWAATIKERGVSDERNDA